MARYVHPLAHKADAANVQEQTADSCDARTVQLSLQGCMSFKWQLETSLIGLYV